MADFDPVRKRQVLDTVLEAAVETKNQGMEPFSKQLLEGVNEAWCRDYTPEQREKVASQNSGRSNIERDEKGEVKSIERHSARGDVSASLSCEPNHLEVLRQRRIIQTALEWSRSDRETIKEMSKYEVEPGDGFDRIARNTLSSGNTLEGRQSEIIENARAIAKLNGFDRDTYNPQKKSLQPGQNVKVHDVDWQLEMMMQSIGRINDWVTKEIDGK